MTGPLAFDTSGGATAIPTTTLLQRAWRKLTAPYYRRRLQELVIDRTKVTIEGIRELRIALPKCNVATDLDK